MANVKIDSVTEAMFAQAVTLSQAGRLRSTVHCGGKEVLILNMDNTIFLRFEGGQEFPEPFSFFANDYESPKIRIDKGQITFITNSGGIRRAKACAIPKSTYVDLRGLWLNFNIDKSQGIRIVKGMVSLLDDGLSHVELSKSAGKNVLLVQRDIYSGTRIEVSRNAGNTALFDENEDIEPFGPIGIRTVDFQALFTFTETLTFYVQKGERPWMYFETDDAGMGGILATCVYDELSEVKKIEV